MWWAAAAPAPALDSDVNSRTTERPKEDMRRTREDKRMREGKRYEHAKDKRRPSSDRTVPKGQPGNMRGAHQEENGEQEEKRKRGQKKPTR